VTPMPRILIAAFACAALTAAPALAQQPLPPPQPATAASITVFGEAQKSVAPDMAQIEAGVSNMAKTAHAAAQANDVAMGQVLLALKGAGVDAKDTQTSQLSLQPQYADRPGPSEIIGYVAKNLVTVKVRDIQAVAGVLDKLDTLGFSDVQEVEAVKERMAFQLPRELRKH